MRQNPGFRRHAIRATRRRIVYEFGPEIGDMTDEKPPSPGAARPPGSRRPPTIDLIATEIESWPVTQASVPPAEPAKVDEPTEPAKVNDPTEPAGEPPEPATEDAPPTAPAEVSAQSQSAPEAPAEESRPEPAAAAAPPRAKPRRRVPSPPAICPHRLRPLRRAPARRGRRWSAPVLPAAPSRLP